HLVAGQLFAAGEFAAAFQAFAPKVTPGSIRLDLSSGVVEVSDEPAKASPVKADGCYVITGGTSGFGLATARWLVSKGAGKIVLVSRSGMKAPGIEAAVRELSAGGARIEVVAGDVSNAEQMKILMEEAAAAPFVLRGIVHGAMVLDDAMMKDLSVESFRRVFQPKAAGALNLAALLPGVDTLDFFLFYSSVSAIVGNRGQTSYVVANSLLDALAHSLRGRGIPTISINWGALAESGVVARDEHLVGVLSSAGIVGLTDNEAFRALEEILQRASAQAGAFKVDWSRWFESHPKLAEDSRFRVLALQSQDSAGGNVAAQLRKNLAEASKEGRLRVIEEMLQEVLATTLKMTKESAALDRKLNELGVDSLMVLELGLGIEERIGIRFSAMELLKGPTLQQLAAMAHNKLWKS
ncbi:MAG TPA: beta-ketoacyl reductase, partial [Chthoniobacterales bacterium]|nr:beta-ketoacyl reductase [Chthoniobacterales bacterium]